MVDRACHILIVVAGIPGSTLAPLAAGVLAVSATLQRSLVTITTAGWLAGIALMLVVLYFVPREVRALRELMQARVEAAAK